MTRWKAFGIHLSISLVIGIAAFCLLYFVYFPQPYFQAAGAGKLVMILLGVDVILGPLLTLVVFKSGKKTLRFDLASVAILQFAALSYGLHIMWVARPVFIVAVVDRIEMVYANNLEDADLAKGVGRFAKRSLTGPEFVSVSLPTDKQEVLDLRESALAGKDIQLMPRYYRPWDTQVTQALLKRAIPTARLPTKAQAAVKHYQANHPGKQIAIIPVRGRIGDYTLVINANNGTQLEALNVAPW
jgi:hypothetical protein